MDLKQKLQALSGKIFEKVVSIQRHIHQYPELSFEEYGTSQYICDRLTEYGIEYTFGYARTGILGVINGYNPSSKTVALRADMDALPITEENDHNYISKHKGIMHACGHDIHTAVLVGVGKILMQLREQFEGRVLLVFQPGEEKLPGGAKLMMEDGVFSQYKPDIILGQHVMPSYEVGTAGFKSGIYMASSDEIYMRIKGKGGHAALPGEAADTVLTAAETIVEIKKRINETSEQRNIPTIISFGKIIAEGATNVIPKEVYVEGTFRTFNEEWRAQAHSQMKEVARNIAEHYGATNEFTIVPGYPSVINNEAISKRTREYAASYLGSDHIIDMPIRLTADDFAYYSQKFPATYYRIGAKPENNPHTAKLHTAKFRVHPGTIKYALELMTWLTLSFLSQD